MRRPLPLAAFLCLLAAASAFGQFDPSADHLPGTEPLVMDEPLDVVMVRGINYFAEREIADSPNRRPAKWNRDYSSPEAYAKSVEPNRQRLREIIGAVDAIDERPRTTIWPRRPGEVCMEVWLEHTHPALAVVSDCEWDVMPGIRAEGSMIYRLTDTTEYKAIVVVIPDADETPESHCDRDGKLAPSMQLARRLAENDCYVLVLAPVNRNDEFSGHSEIRHTNMPHREYVYRMAYEMGRHIIGYEVAKVLAAVNVCEVLQGQIQSEGDAPKDLPIAIAGVGEGGLIAMYAAACDHRIDAALVSGYFSERERVWQEPIYRNVWGLVSEFGDEGIASLIAPRPLVIDTTKPPFVDRPPQARDGRSAVAAPGRIQAIDEDVVSREFDRAKAIYERLGAEEAITLATRASTHDSAAEAAVREKALAAFLQALNINEMRPAGEVNPKPADYAEEHQRRQQRQIRELVDYTQKLLHRSDKARDKLWANVDRSSVDNCVASLEAYREMVYDRMIGRLPEPTIPVNPRTRKVIDEETHVGYEVVLDCYPAGDIERPIPDGADVNVPDTGSVDKIGWAVGKDWGVIAGGILLLPKDLKEGERRPVVVCQHGLEGVPMDTIVTDPNSKGYGPYKGFSTALVQRGFIVYVPQNPYRGHDAFRVIQRKSNPMGRSLFSYIIPQHARTLEWLASLPNVDPERIAFYGLSYGGKTAVRVPPMLPPREGQPGYCLSICSADFNEWVRKNASSEDRYSYVYTGEYEIFEWNMGHVANYAELSYLMTPRPFMVERGHDDGVAPDEWVAWEFAKVKRHYDKLGLGDRTEMEVFNGPHTINGVGTYAFLHKHLNWPERGGSAEK